MTAFWIAIGAVFIALGASALARASAQAKHKRHPDSGAADVGGIASDTSSADCGTDSSGGDCGSGGDGGGGGGD